MVARQGVVLPAPPPVVWPPDDTEESVMGTDLHQTAITNLRLGINELAAVQTPPGGLLPWQAGGQTIYRDFRRPDGSSYRMLPDIFAVRRPFDRRRKSLSLAEHGTPLLIVEVLSDTTYEQDLDIDKGKGFSYARAGVREYLTLDWSGAYLPERGRGWRLEDNAYQTWLPDGMGRWQSRELPLAIGMEGPMVAVYTLDGRRLPREGEIERERLMQERRHADELARRERRHAEERARLDAELANVRRRLEDLERGDDPERTS
jgi:hypothetical protein